MRSRTSGSSRWAALHGLQPAAAVEHNFVYPCKLVSLRLRGRWIARFRASHYPLAKFERGLDTLSDDPAVNAWTSWIVASADRRLA